VLSAVLADGIGIAGDGSGVDPVAVPLGVVSSSSRLKTSCFCRTSEGPPMLIRSFCSGAGGVGTGFGTAGWGVLSCRRTSGSGTRSATLGGGGVGAGVENSIGVGGAGGRLAKAIRIARWTIAETRNP
jgi:hypothetical protein